MSRITKVVLSFGGAEVTLTTKMDHFGEFMGTPFVETLKNVTAEIVTIIRNEDIGIPPHLEDYWKL